MEQSNYISKWDPIDQEVYNDFLIAVLIVALVVFSVIGLAIAYLLCLQCHSIDIGSWIRYFVGQMVVL